MAVPARPLRGAFLTLARTNGPRPALLPLQVFDDFLRKRASKLGANLVNALFMGCEQSSPDGPITVRYNEYKEGELAGASIGCWVGSAHD